MKPADPGAHGRSATDWAGESLPPMAAATAMEGVASDRIGGPGGDTDAPPPDEDTVVTSMMSATRGAPAWAGNDLPPQASEVATEVGANDAIGGPGSDGDDGDDGTPGDLFSSLQTDLASASTQDGSAGWGDWVGWPDPTGPGKDVPPATEGHRPIEGIGSELDWGDFWQYHGGGNVDLFQ